MPSRLTSYTGFSSACLPLVAQDAPAPVQLDPVVAAAERAVARQVTRLQSGRLDAYLTYMLIALVAVLAVVTAIS